MRAQALAHTNPPVCSIANPLIIGLQYQQIEPPLIQIIREPIAVCLGEPPDS